MADNRFNRTFVNDAQGNAVYVNQGAGQAGNLGGRIQNLPGGYVGGFIGDADNPGHIQRQLVVNGEVLARYGDAPNTEKLPTSSSEKPTYQNTAEFKLNAAPLKLKGANLDPVAYTIVGGETLKGIARNVLGDASLWWRIADANGLSVSGDGQLTPGQTLSVPKLALNSNNVETFQPYDPSQVTGSTDPLLPAPAGQGGRGCGGLGRIIMVVVAVVASIYTAGAASALLGTAGTTLSGAMAAGSAALTGGGLAGIGAGAMAIGGAVGSIASQAVGNLIGAQDGFSWRSVGLSAIGGGISGGMGGWAPLGEATSTGTAVGNAMIRAAVGNVASQGIGVVAGLQSSFSWQSVAASAVGAGVGQAVGGALGMNERGFSELSFGQQFGTRLLTGVAAGTAAAIARGGRVAIQQVATDAFGNALGSSLADAMGQQNTAQESFRRGEINQQNAQARTDALYGLSSSGSVRLGDPSGMGATEWWGGVDRAISRNAAEQSAIEQRLANLAPPSYGSQPGILVADASGKLPFTPGHSTQSIFATYNDLAVQNYNDAKLLYNLSAGLQKTNPEFAKTYRSMADGYMAAGDDARNSAKSFYVYSEPMWKNSTAQTLTVAPGWNYMGANSAGMASGAAIGNFSGTLGGGIYAGVGGEVEIEFASGQIVGGKAGMGIGYGFHLSRSAVSGALMQGPVYGYKSTPIAEFNPQQEGSIRFGPSVAAGGGIGIVGIEQSFGMGIDASSAGNRFYVQGSTNWTTAPVIPKLGFEVKANMIEFSVKPTPPGSR